MAYACCSGRHCSGMAVDKQLAVAHLYKCLLRTHICFNQSVFCNERVVYAL